MLEEFACSPVATHASVDVQGQAMDAITIGAQNMLDSTRRASARIVPNRRASAEHDFVFSTTQLAMLPKRLPYQASSAPHIESKGLGS